MPFTVKNWIDAPDASTPLSAAAMEDLEQRLSDWTTGRTGPGRSVSGGKSIIAASESRSNAAYGLLRTPDRVLSVVLPTDGLIAIWYKATWQESVNDAARAAIFISGNQLKIATENLAAAPTVQEAACGARGARHVPGCARRPGPEGRGPGDARGRSATMNQNRTKKWRS